MSKDGILSEVELDLLRELTGNRISRRELLEGAAMMGLAGLLAACGLGGSNSSNAASAARTLQPPKPVVDGDLYLFNWN